MYRTVVSQQGRVTVEADANEAEEIRTAEGRADLIDVIGPSGSPDDGFLISVPAATGEALDFAIGGGVIYVGGVRVVSTDRTPSYFSQRETEWLDYPQARLPYTVPDGAFSELVYLTLTEQEVGVVEDPALREVALGGPDTAARTRLIQRVQRLRADNGTCQNAIDTLLAQTWGPALTFEPATMRLRSTQQLKIDFVKPPGPADPCQPTAQAGFLGAENQLIRVQVAADGASLLWGYDNASFLYRVTISSTDASVLTLAAPPVDVFHQPRVGQWVEVLASAVASGVDDAFVAAGTGVAAQVKAYDPGALTLTLTTALGADFLATVASTEALPKQVFVRVWENKQPFAADDTALELVTNDLQGTGVQVYAKGANRAPGDYWMIGVRPDRADEVFPSRLRGYQPPDGPARWAVPLAVIAWQGDHVHADVTDCRHHFKNLVDLTEEDSGCCELLLQPTDDAQARIDERIKKNAAKGIAGLHVKFASGAFSFTKTIVINMLKPGDLTISGCGLASQLEAATQEVVLLAHGWTNVSVSDLTVSAGTSLPGQGTKRRADQYPPVEGADHYRHLGGAITILDCASADIERVVARCASAALRASSCIHVRHHTSGAARVRGCDLWPGPNQVGVLVINADRATIDDNRIRLNGKADEPSWRPELQRFLVDGLHFTEKASNMPATRKRIALTNNNLKGSFTTNPAVAEAWTQALAIGGAPTNANAARKRISAIVGQVLDGKEGPLSAELVSTFQNAVEAEQKVLKFATSIGKGIVVAGAVATDVRIVNNTIDDAQTGIAVGLSQRVASWKTDRSPIHADRVQVVGNTISQRVPRDRPGVNAGIFIGNVDYATVRDNRIATQYEDGQPLRRGEGIRIWGQLGPMVIVSHNACYQSEVGIRFHWLAGGAMTRLWRVTQNLVNLCTTGMIVSSSVDAGDNVIA